MVSLRTSALVALLIAAVSLPVSALQFSVQSVNCSQLSWSVGLSQTEWSVSSYIELFFVSQQGGQNYSLLYSALPGGEFGSPGTYDKVANFGDSRLSGQYRIGVGLTDMNGNILTTTTSASSSTVQVSAIDPRTFTFGDCTRNAQGSTSTAKALASTIASRASTMTSASTPRSWPASVLSASRTSLAATSTSVSAAPVSSLPSGSASASSSGLATSHSVNKGAIAGGVIGAIILILILLALLRWSSSRRTTRRLSHASQRMSALRPLTLSEKLGGSPRAARCADSLRHKTVEAYVASDTLDAAALSRLSESSQLRSQAYTPYSPSHDGMSMNNVMTVFPSAHSEQEIRVVNEPFSLNVGQRVASPYGATSVDPRLALCRTTSIPLQTQLTDRIPVYPSHSNTQHHQGQQPRPKSTPIHAHLAPINTTALTSGTGATSHSRLTRPSAAACNFKIPRVSVPTYLASNDIEAAAAGDAFSESTSRPISTSSSFPTLSAGGTTRVSLNADPFVDAAEEQHSNSRPLL